MRAQLVAEVGRSGVITRREALRIVPEHVLDDAIADHALTRIFPQVYALPSKAKDRNVRRHGAVAHRPRTALSAIDALDVWGVFPFAIPSAEPIHVMGNRREPASESPDLKVHRHAGFALKAPLVWETRGLHVVRLEQAIVDSWTMLAERDRRVPVITAVRERRTTGLLLLEVLAANRRATGAAEMRRVFEIAAAGVHSPLELWGHDKVFSHPSMPRSKWRCVPWVTRATRARHPSRCGTRSLGHPGRPLQPPTTVRGSGGSPAGSPRDPVRAAAPARPLRVIWGGLPGLQRPLRPGSAPQIGQRVSVTRLRLARL